ncbi:hypothetical protein R0K05_23140, partial [Planococcus sp. SIMBA_160]
QAWTWIERSSAAAPASRTGASPAIRSDWTRWSRQPSPGATTATTAETIEQLTIEVDTLKRLEQMALGVLRSGEDAKWQQLNR